MLNTNNTDLKTLWEENRPDTLKDQSMRYILHNPGIIFYAIDRGKHHANSGIINGASNDNIGHESFDNDILPICRKRPKLLARETHSVRYEEKEPKQEIHFRFHPGVSLPTEISERLLEMIHDEGFDVNDCILTAFGDSSGGKLRRVKLRHSTVTDLGLSTLLRHKIKSLDLMGCDQLTEKSLKHLNHNCCDSLLELKVSGSYKDVRKPITLFPKCFSVGSANSVEQDVFDSLSISEHVAYCQKNIISVRNSDEIMLSEKTVNQSAVISISNCNYDSETTVNDNGFVLESSDTDSILNTPKLQTLYIHDLEITKGLSYFPHLFRNLRNLTHLDLSGCEHREGMNEFTWLPECLKDTLTSLVLYNVDEIDLKAIKNIIKLEKLRHLDISKHPDRVELDHFDNPNGTLKLIVESLSDLISLDISATNLAGNGVFEYEHSLCNEHQSRNSHIADEPDLNHNLSMGNNDMEICSDDCRWKFSGEMPLCDIVGLISRVNVPLDFLGLYKSVNEPNNRAHIPAKEVSGDKDENQLLVAGRRYINRPDFLIEILNDLFIIVKGMEYKNLHAFLNIILTSMNKYPEEIKIQHAGSACLYYVVRDEPKERINTKIKQKIMQAVLNAMFSHKDDADMMRNGCLILCQFDIPQDVVFDYERLVRILLYIVSAHDQNPANFVQRSGIILLNSLACQVEGRQKLLVGDLGAMEKMLWIIRERLKSKNCDEVLETAWSTMWNVTDETPLNCQRFLDGQGMELFLLCKKEFPESHPLLRNMMGLLGNVAEVPNLRPTLMTQAFVTEFAELLDSNLDGIEVSYNAASVLAHMASDGYEAWTIESPPRQSVLSRMVTAIEGWDLSTRRNINYRSFEPILRLIRVFDTPECQYWAVWALANLTKVDSEKYINLIEKEGGLILLNDLINANEHPETILYQKVIDLANVVMGNVLKWNEKKLSSNKIVVPRSSGCNCGNTTSESSGSDAQA